MNELAKELERLEARDQKELLDDVVLAAVELGFNDSPQGIDHMITDAIDNRDFAVSLGFDSVDQALRNIDDEENQ